MSKGLTNKDFTAITGIGETACTQINLVEIMLIRRIQGDESSGGGLVESRYVEWRVEHDSCLHVRYTLYVAYGAGDIRRGAAYAGKDIGEAVLLVVRVLRNS